MMAVAPSHLVVVLLGTLSLLTAAQTEAPLQCFDPPAQTGLGEVCFRAAVDPCEQRVDIKVTYAGSDVFDEQINDFATFEICQPQGGGCEVRVLACVLSSLSCVPYLLSPSFACGLPLALLALRGRGQE